MSFRPKVLIFLILSSAIFVAAAVRLTKAEETAPPEPERMCDEAGFVVGTKCKCPPDNDPRVTVICGEVKSTYLKEDEVTGVKKKIALPNVTVALYEPWTESETNKAEGSLTNLYSSTYTDAYGNFTIFARKYRKGDDYSYIAFRCGSRTGPKGAVGIRHDVYDLNIQAPCATDIAYEEPPANLADLALSTTPVACYMDEPKYNLVNSESDSGKAQWTPKVEGGETNYDIRFAPFKITFGPYPITVKDGALWREDCAKRHPSDADKCFWSESPSPSDENYSEIIRANTLPFIPTTRNVTAYRTFESRVSFTGKETQPDVFAKYSKTMLGDYVGNVFRVSHGSSMEEDKLVSCKSLKDSGSILANSEEGVLNSQTSGGPAMHLSTPFLWKEISQQVDIDTTRRVCKDDNGDPVTLGELPPICGDCKAGTAGCACKFNQEDLSFRPELLFDANDVTETWGTAAANDSYNSTAIRTDLFKPVENEGEKPFSKKSTNVYPSGGKNANNAPTTALEISGQIRSDYQDIAGGNLTNVVSTPAIVAGEDEEDKTNNIYTIGNKVRELCVIPGEAAVNSVPEDDTDTEGQLILDNYFTGATPEHGQVSQTGGTYTVGTQQGFDRDSEYRLHTDIVDDAIDSILRIQSGSGKVNLSAAQVGGQILMNLTGLLFGDSSYRKTMGDRSSTLNNMEVVTKGLTAKFSLAQENFEDWFPIPQPPFDAGSWGEGRAGVYSWHKVGAGAMCNDNHGSATRNVSYGGVNYQISPTCRVDVCGTYNNAIMTCDCDDGVVKHCGDPEPLAGCSEAEILRCAENQTTVDLGGGTRPFEEGDSCGCPPGEDQCEISGVVNGYTCQVSFAGPMEEYGELNLDMNTKLKQETMNVDGAPVQEEVASDSMSTTYNDLVRSLSSPYVVGDTLPPKYQNMGFVNFRSTNTLDEEDNPQPAVTDRKDVVTAGIDPAPLMSVASDPTSYGVSFPYPEVTYHCDDYGTPDAKFTETEEDCSLQYPSYDEPSGNLICWGAETDESKQFCQTGDPDIGNAKGLEDALQGLTQTYMNPLVDTDLNVANFEMCYCELARQAASRGFDPAYTVAIWVEESGASNYEEFPGVEDLGIHGGGVPVENLEAQFDNFKGLESYYTVHDIFGYCLDVPPSAGSLTVDKFLRIYHFGGDAVCSQPDPWVDQIQIFYQALHRDSVPMDLNKVITGWNTFD